MWQNWVRRNKLCEKVFGFHSFVRPKDIDLSRIKFHFSGSAVHCSLFLGPVIAFFSWLPSCQCEYRTPSTHFELTSIVCVCVNESMSIPFVFQINLMRIFLPIITLIVNIIYTHILKKYWLKHSPEIHWHDRFCFWKNRFSLLDWNGSTQLFVVQKSVTPTTLSVKSVQWHRYLLRTHVVHPYFSEMVEVCVCEFDIVILVYVSSCALDLIFGIRSFSFHLYIPKWPVMIYLQCHFDAVSTIDIMHHSTSLHFTMQKTRIICRCVSCVDRVFTFFQIRVLGKFTRLKCIMSLFYSLIHKMCVLSIWFHIYYLI